MKKASQIMVALVVSVIALAFSSISVYAAETEYLDPVWERTVNSITSSTTELGTALPSSDSGWGGWTDSVWTGGEIGIFGNQIPDWVENDTWLYWEHNGQDYAEHADMWLRTTIEIPESWTVAEASVVYKKDSSYFPINDNLYLYIDGVYCAGGGTAGWQGTQALIKNATGLDLTPPDPTGGAFITASWDDVLAPETEWFISYIDGGLKIPAGLLGPGTHTIEILCEEFDTSGGIGHPVFKIQHSTNFVTGGSTVKDSAGKKVLWTASGNVGFKQDGTLTGVFTIVDHQNKNQYKCQNDFVSLIFSGGPTNSPAAQYNIATIVGNFTDKKGNVHVLTLVITDVDDSGRDSDTIYVTGGLDFNYLLGPGNYQIHEGFK